MVQIIFLAFYFSALFLLALFGLHKYFLFATYRKYKNQKIAVPPKPEEWPLVSIQLPIFNERYVLKRLLRGVINMDYPREKLEIQVLDDSTDDTARLAARMVALLQKKGFRIVHIHRTKRTGFKAGALANGLKMSAAEFLAVFDADFVPPPDFLTKTIPHLMQPGVGMVQTRWGHINRNYSLLTRIQSIFLDGHFIIEHTARNRSGRFFNFNGTAGVWRRQAIEEAGGWQHDTLTEDLDLSYRAQLAGWRFIFLPDVVSPAELPVEMNAYKSQQHRWAKGSVQTALKLFPQLWKADLPFYIRLEAFIHLGSNLSYLLMAIPALLMIPAIKIEMHSHFPGFIIAYLFMFFAATLSVVLYYGYAIKESCGRLWPEVIYIPLVMAVGIGLSLNNGRAALEALIGYKSDFKRTPKFRIEKRSDTYKFKLYKPGRTHLYYFEFLLAAYFTYGFSFFLLKGFYFSLPFFLLFQFGFLYIALTSFSGQWNFLARRS